MDWTHWIAGALFLGSPQNIPSNVVTAIQNTATIDSLEIPAGQLRDVGFVLKVRNLTLTPGSVLRFPAQSRIGADTYILAVTNLNLIVGTPRQNAPLITFLRTRPRKMSQSCGRRPDGRSGSPRYPDGGNGGPGVPGLDASSRQPEYVYAVIGNVTVNTGTPSSSELLNLNFDGLDGDGGGDGCRGGKGGDGLDASSWNRAGNAGVPGRGGHGGAPASGQAGASFSWFASPTVYATSANFIVSVEGGKPGTPGSGALCGPEGHWGHGTWDLPGGHGNGCLPPPRAPDGVPASKGMRGIETKTQGDFSAILPSPSLTKRTLRRRSAHRAEARNGNLNASANPRLMLEREKLSQDGTTV